MLTRTRQPVWVIACTGTVRTVDSPVRSPLDPQHTPAIKQFSTPRVVNDDPYRWGTAMREPTRPPPRHLAHRLTCLLFYATVTAPSARAAS